MKETMSGVYRKDGRIYTKNLVPGSKVYGENLLREGGEEFRSWDPNRSKLSAAIKKGLSNFPFDSSSVVLYLGIASGTTASHLSDIVKMIYGVDISPRVLRDLVKVAKERQNISPLLQDAFTPEKYSDLVPEVDVLYQDVSSKKQGEIFIKNSKFLKKGGYGLIAIKARSIDVTKDPKKIYEGIKEELETNLNVEFLEEKDLSPFEKDHLMLILRVF